MTFQFNSLKTPEANTAPFLRLPLGMAVYRATDFAAGADAAFPDQRGCGA
jgi:hypothetical protein